MSVANDRSGDVAAHQADHQSGQHCSTSSPSLDVQSGITTTPSAALAPVPAAGDDGSVPVKSTLPAEHAPFSQTPWRLAQRHRSLSDGYIDRHSIAPAPFSQSPWRLAQRHKHLPDVPIDHHSAASAPAATIVSDLSRSVGALFVSDHGIAAPPTAAIPVIPTTGVTQCTTPCTSQLSYGSLGATEVLDASLCATPSALGSTSNVGIPDHCQHDPSHISQPVIGITSSLDTSSISPTVPQVSNASAQHYTIADSSDTCRSASSVISWDIADTHRHDVVPPDPVAVPLGSSGDGASLSNTESFMDAPAAFAHPGLSAPSLIVIICYFDARFVTLFYVHVAASFMLECSLYSSVCKCRVLSLELPASYRLVDRIS